MFSVTKNMKKLLLAFLPVVFAATPPPEPQGPPGTIFKYDLLKSFNGGRLGAFNTVDWNPGFVNNEVQYYKPENAQQDPSTGEITIKAERRQDGNVYSARYFLSYSNSTMRKFNTYFVYAINICVSL